MLRIYMFAFTSALLLTSCIKHPPAEEIHQTKALANLYTQSEQVVDLIALPLAYFCHYNKWPSQVELKEMVEDSPSTYIDLTSLVQAQRYIIHYRLKNQNLWELGIARPRFVKGEPTEVAIVLKESAFSVEQKFTMPVGCDQQELIFY